MALTAFLSLLSTSCTAPLGSPAATIAEEVTSAITLFEANASDPPFKITAFPDLIHNAATSAVTFGRDS